MGFKTLLAIPPDYDHNFPPLGTPALCAFLKKNGMACEQTDLNLKYRDHLAGHVSGDHKLDIDEQRFFLRHLRKKFFAERLKGRYYSEFLPHGEALLKDLPYNNNTNSSFHFCERLLSSEKLWRYLEDRDDNTFYRFYEASGILDRLKKDGVGLFGISVTSPTQAIASLTLGLMVKQRLPNIHVTIGGQWVTLYRDAILEEKELFRCFDSMIVFEGETALLELARRLESGKDIASIPNILVSSVIARPAIGGPKQSYQSLGKIASLAQMENKGSLAMTHAAGESMNTLPCPDFDGLPLEEYDENKKEEICLTYETSRGCYWSKCAYCVDLPIPKPSYRRKDPKLVAKDMRRLKERYGAGYLFFGDPGLSPRQMREISEEILETA